MAAYMIPLMGQPAPREDPSQAYNAGAQAYLQRQQMQAQTSNYQQDAALRMEQAKQANIQTQMDQQQLQWMRGLQSTYAEAATNPGGTSAATPAPVPTPPAQAPAAPAAPPSTGPYLAPQLGNQLAAGLQSAPTAPPALPPAATTVGNLLTQGLQQGPDTSTGPTVPPPSAAQSAPTGQPGADFNEQVFQKFLAKNPGASMFLMPIRQKLLEYQEKTAQTGLAATNLLIANHNVMQQQLIAKMSTPDPNTGQPVWRDPSGDPQAASDMNDLMQSWHDNKLMTPQEFASFNQMHAPGQEPNAQALATYSNMMYATQAAHLSAQKQLQETSAAAQKTTHEAAMYPGEEAEQTSKTAAAALQTISEQSKVDAAARSDAGNLLGNAAALGRDNYLNARSQVIHDNRKLQDVNWPEPPADPNQYNASQFAQQVRTAALTPEQGATLTENQLRLQEIISHNREMEALAAHRNENNPRQHTDMISSLADQAIAFSAAGGGGTPQQALADVNNPNLYKDGAGKLVGQYRGEVVQELQNRIDNPEMFQARIGQIDRSNRPKQGGRGSAILTQQLTGQPAPGSSGTPKPGPSNPAPAAPATPQGAPAQAGGNANASKIFPRARLADFATANQMTAAAAETALTQQGYTVK